MDQIRCRIAPSPSGFLHIGTAKIALFNWLFARKNGGTFVLRLEDTDAERTDESFVQAMCEGFQWLGIDWDEGPPFGDEPQKGDYGPYRQSDRKAIYQQETQRLLDEGKAYKCFCTREELEAERERAQQEKRPPRYSQKCRNLSPEEVAAMGDRSYVVRFKVPDGSTEVNDLVQGTVRCENKEFDDFVIQKPNGDPIFHMAVVVDDGQMQISHVIRGDDHLTNATRHVMLFQALGYPVPEFAHLPMVLDEKGKKYSKRLHGANVLDWRNDGYLPEALINYVALLGWTPEEPNRELFTIDELLEAFVIKRWGKSAARFDRKKLDWLNGRHIRLMDTRVLMERVIPVLEEAGFNPRERSEDWLLRMTEICQEKIGTINNIIEYADFFFKEINSYEPKAVKKQYQKEGAETKLQQLIDALTPLEDWSADMIKAAFEALAEAQGEKLGAYIHPARLAFTGKSVGPGLFELAELLGKDACLERLQNALDYVNVGAPLPEVQE